MLKAIEIKPRGNYLESSVVEGGQDGDGGVNVLELSQQNVVVVGVHVGVDPKEEGRLMIGFDRKVLDCLSALSLKFQFLAFPSHLLASLEVSSETHGGELIINEECR